MAVSLWGLLLAAPGRGLHLQGAAEVRPQVPGVCAAVQQQPPAEEDGHPRVHPHRDNEDHKVPSAHRAADQDGEGPASRAAEASQLSLSRQVNPHRCERPGLFFSSVTFFDTSSFLSPFLLSCLYIKSAVVMSRCVPYINYKIDK